MVQLFHIMQKISQEIFLPLMFFAVVLSMVWLYCAKPERKLVMALAAMILSPVLLFLTMHGISSRYALVYTAGAMLGIGAGLEELFRRYPKIAWSVLWIVLLTVSLRSAFFFRHPACFSIVGKALARDARHEPGAVIIAEKAGDAVRLKNDTALTSIFAYEEKKEWLKNVWIAHYSASVVYHVGTGEAPFLPEYMVRIPGLQNALKAELFMHTYKNYHKKKELFVYRQKMEADVFLPEKKRTLLPDGNFERGFSLIPHTNDKFIFNIPKGWNVLAMETLDPEKPVTILPCRDPRSGSMKVEISMPQQSLDSSLLLISPAFVPGERLWIAFDAELSADTEMDVQFCIYDESGQGMGYETVLHLDGKINHGKRQYRIPLAPDLWQIQGKTKRLCFRIRQGKIRMNNFFLLEY